ncbi:MAG: hypothetical protein AB1426_04950 [Bacillota bacterium]
MRSIASLLTTLAQIGVKFVPVRSKGRVDIRLQTPWRGEPPPEVEPLVKDLAERREKAVKYLVEAKLIGEAVSLHGERLRIYRTRPICELTCTCWQSILRCNRDPENGEFGWTKRCREKVQARQPEGAKRGKKGAAER